jgi:hypothetical protein
MAATTLPVGWGTVTFGDVVRQVKDRVDPEISGLERYVAGEHMDTDDLRIRRWGTIGDGYLGPAFHMRFKPGHVLYGSRRTYLRKVAVADFDGICANTTFVVEPSTPELLPEFLPLVMTTEAFHAHSIEQSKGSVNPYINFRDLTWYEFALPPVPVQYRIVEAQSVGSALIDSYSMAEIRRNGLRRSVLAEAALSAEATATVAEFGDVVRGSRFPTKHATPAGAVPFLKVADLGEQLDLVPIVSARNYVSEEVVAALGIKPVQPGAILFQRVGASLRHDRKWLLGIRACVDENILAVRPFNGTSSETLFGLLQQTTLRGIVQEGAVPSINEKIVRSIRVPQLSSEQGRLLDLQLLELRRLGERLRTTLEASSGLATSLRELMMSGASDVQ